MDWLSSRIFKVISFVVLFFFTWTSGGLFQAAYAIKDSQGSGVESSELKTEKPEQKLQKTLEEIEQIITDTSSDTNTKKTKVKSKKTEIGNIDVEIKKQFKETEEKIKDLPDEILQRHKDFVKHYDDNLKELNTNLDAIDKAKTDVEINAAIEKTKTFLEKVKSPKKHTPLDPDNLPHRTAEPEWIEPRTSPEQFLEELSADAQKSNSPEVSEAVISKMSFPLVGNLSEDRLRTSRSDRGGYQSNSRKPILVASNGSLDRLLNQNSEVRSQKPEFTDSGYLPTGQAGPIETFWYDKGSGSSSVFDFNSTNSELSTPLLLAAATPPSTADLAQTIEVQFTPEITAKAEELQHNPVKIYNWVRNNIEFVPTYGSIQGANMCLQTKQCNAFDTASLLIALLRLSGIHAKYVQGTVEIPIEKVKNWVGGFTDTMSALNLLASAGIPTAGQVVGGEIKYVRIEHVWVDAYIDYIPSRGEIHKQGDTWIPLDASFKQNDYSNSGVNLFGTLPFDYDGFYDSLRASATIDPATGSVTGVDTNLGESLIAGYIAQGDSYISTNYTNATDEVLFGEKVITERSFTFLLGTLPYRVITRGAVFSAIPATLQHRVHFSVIKDVTDDIIGSPISYPIALPAIAGKRVSLSYKPATSSDIAVLRSLFPKLHQDGSPLQLSEMPQSFPSYLLQLKPTLWIDGKVVASGTAIGMGQSETFTVTLSRPNRSSNSIVNEAISGEYYGIYIDTGFLDHDFIIEKVLDHYSHLTAALEKTVVPTSDSIVGELLNNLAGAYFSQLTFFEKEAAQVDGIINYRLPSLGMAQAVLNVKYAFGTPFSASLGGIMMDIDHYISLTGAVDGDREKVKNFNLVTGIYGSSLEHSIPEQFFSLPDAPAEGISAVKLLGLANSQNIPVYTITKFNIATILPLLHVDADVLTDIRNAVNAGKEVIVPERNLTVTTWQGIGYLVLDPTTGNGGYIISGGKNGGFLFALATYWMQIGAQAMEGFRDDPMFGMEIIQSGINLILIAQDLWTQVLKTAGGVAFDLAINFLPWGKVVGGAKTAAMPLIAAITKPKFMYNISKGRRLEQIVLKNLLGDLSLAEKRLFLTKKGATIPDHIVRDAMDVNKITELWEIKNWKSLNAGDGNIPKLLELAKSRNIPLNVVVGNKTTVSSELVKAVCSTGGLVFRYSAVTKIFDDIPCKQ